MHSIISVLRRLNARLGNFPARIRWLACLAFLLPRTALAATERAAGGGEANLILPDLGSVTVMGMSGRSLLLVGMLVAFAGIGFGIVALFQVKRLPVHRSMSDISDLIWETCKTYLFTQGKFLLWLEVLIGAVKRDPGMPELLPLLPIALAENGIIGKD